MSRQTPTQARKKTSVSSHPLFPAIVALWFGALFGLGSLAVRPSLLESLVISSHLDVIVPMTAPPLGMTARILLAVTLAVIGIAIGATIARWIARPKPVERQRRRSAANVVGKAKARGFAGTQEAAQQQTEPQEAALSVASSGRRRSLSVEHQEQSDYRLEAAPVPGGSPAIFDVTQIDLDAPVALASELESDGVERQPLELDTFVVPELAQAEAHSSHDCLMLDEQAAVPALVSTDATSERQVFGQPQPAFDTLQSSDFAYGAPELAADDSELSPSPARSHPYLAEPAPFTAAAPVAMSIPDKAEIDFAPSPVELRRFKGPAQDETPIASASQPNEPEPLANLIPLPAETPVLQANLAPRLGTAAERIASANLAELSPVELIERFALALQQRRHTGAIPEGMVAAAASLASVASAEPICFAPPVAQVAPAPATPPEAMPIPVACDEAGDTRVGIPASPLTLPTALRPIDLSEFDDHDDHPSYVPPRSMVMPAAADAAPALGAPTDYPAISAPVAPESLAVGEDAAEAGDESDVLEESYSSLLDLNRPTQLRQPYVRIEEPAADFAPVEPVVIFPGQDARSGMRFARPADVAAPQENQTAAVQEPLDDAAPGVRRFDAPGTNAVAVSANPVAAQDPTEAERALRSALATLQRMSGAA